MPSIGMKNKNVPEKTQHGLCKPVLTWRKMYRVASLVTIPMGIYLSVFLILVQVRTPALLARIRAVSQAPKFCECDFSKFLCVV